MSIDTGTPDPFAAPGDQCPLCWPANQTPKYIYLTLTGILYGTATPGLGTPPPNGLWQLEATNACLYELQVGPIEFIYQVNPAFTFFQAWDGHIEFYFTNADAAQCLRSIANGFQNPAADEYYGGFATIYDFTESDESTIQENLALMNIKAQEGTFINIRSSPADTAVKIISSHRENINIAIKEETT